MASAENVEMTTPSAARRFIEAYNGLIARGRFIVGGAPYWQYVDPDSPCQIAVEGATATFSWVTPQTDYDLCVLEAHVARFPARLLTLPDDELQAWKAREKARYDDEQRARRAADEQAKARQRRAIYERLKAEFDPGAS